MVKTAVNEVFPIIKNQESKMPPVKRNILLNPGPATTTDSVKYALVTPDICPRESEFGDIMEYISKELTGLVADTDKFVTVLFGGSGTAAVESILSSVVDKDCIIIINNGAYGKRMCEIAKIYGLNFIEFKSSGFDRVNLKDLEETIKSSRYIISHLAVVHNETTTGLLNDISCIGHLCQKYNIDLIVDAMSSFAAVQIDMMGMKISYLTSNANKNLQGIAGVSFVIADKSKLETTKAIPPRNLYLNLYAQYDYFIKHHQMRFTPPVQLLYALRQAIIELKQEGMTERYKRYSRNWEVLLNGLEELNLRYLISKENHSRIITTIVEPENPKYNFNDMHDYLYERGFTIYPGKLSDLNTFRIANIGDITEEDIKFFLNHLKAYIETLI